MRERLISQNSELIKNKEMEIQTTGISKSTQQDDFNDKSTPKAPFLDSQFPGVYLYITVVQFNGSTGSRGENRGS